MPSGICLSSDICNPPQFFPGSALSGSLCEAIWAEACDVLLGWHSAPSRFTFQEQSLPDGHLQVARFFLFIPWTAMPFAQVSEQVLLCLKTWVEQSQNPFIPCAGGEGQVELEFSRFLGTHFVLWIKGTHLQKRPLQLQSKLKIALPSGSKPSLQTREQITSPE